MHKRSSAKEPLGLPSASELTKRVGPGSLALRTNRSEPAPETSTSPLPSGAMSRRSNYGYFQRSGAIACRTCVDRTCGFADGLRADGLSPSTIRNTLMPLRAIFRRAVSRGDVGLNPTAGIELPAVRGRRDRIASPGEAASLLDALPAQDRALWATALYAGLRLGELRALRWEDVDLAIGLIRVNRSWDPKEGVIEPKSQAARRRVPIPAALRDFLIGRGRL